jgi:outer membrane protein assembly factor BamB
MRRLCLSSVCVLTYALCSPAADWPQFLGPNRDGSAAETVPAWSAPPQVVWRQPVGEAHSSPVVADGVVYAFYKPKGRDADALAAFDAATGDPKWERSYDRAKFTPAFGTGPRGTPAVAGGKVYTLGNTGVLACWDAKTGDLAWKVDTLQQYAAKNLFFGVSTSPTVVGDKVVVMVGGKGAGVVAFDAATGKEAWKATDDPASYASPLPVDGGKNLVFLTGSHLRCLAAADGKEVWAVPFKDRLNESSTTPVAAGGLTVGSSVTAGSIAVKPAAGGAPETAWKAPQLTCYFSTPVAVGPHLYLVTGVASLTNPTIALRCVETATGKVLWTKEKIGKYHAALTRTADDKLLMLDDAGNLILLQPDPAGYKEVCRAKACGPTWAHPALADGKLYVRDEKNELICLKLK